MESSRIRRNSGRGCTHYRNCAWQLCVALTFGLSLS
jgi:hypothetical protein